jgi:hypothetical protein
MLRLIVNGSSVMTMTTNSNVTDDRRDVQEVPRTSGFETADSCLQMDFYLYAVLAGTMCLFGFIANTVNLMMVRKHRSSLLHCVRVDRMISDFDMALQVGLLSIQQIQSCVAMRLLT